MAGAPTKPTLPEKHGTAQRCGVPATAIRDRRIVSRARGDRVLQRRMASSAQKAASVGTVAYLRPLDSDDATLVMQSRSGSENAKRELVRRHTRHVAGVLVNVLGARSDLGDLLQETFLVVFRDLDKLRDPGAFKPWLTTIAVGRARNALRSRRRRWWLRFVSHEEVPEQATNPEHEEAIRAVYEVLERFDPDEQLTFALRFIAGMELAEVARATDVSLATVKRRLDDVRRKFEKAAATDMRLARWVSGGVHGA